MSAETYNGYCNRETWATALHCNNDEAMQRATENQSAKGLQYIFEALANDVIEDGSSRDVRLMLADIGSLWRVDWNAVAEACRTEGAR